VNVASAWLLVGGDYHHGHPHGHSLAQENTIMMSTPHHDTRRRGNFGDLSGWSVTAFPPAL
jgi:hypothetical protein